MSEDICSKCGGSGIFTFNTGEHGGPCFACKGKGTQEVSDQMRNKAYWEHRRIQELQIAALEEGEVSEDHFDQCPQPTHWVKHEDDSNAPGFGVCPRCADEELDHIGPFGVGTYIRRNEYGDKIHYTITPINPKEEMMEDRNHVVAGTGSRSLQIASSAIKKAVFNYLLKVLGELKEKYGDRLRVMSGMAEGFDKALALAALQLDIKVIAAIPNKGYGAYYWGEPSEDRRKGGSLTGEDRYDEFHDIIERIKAGGGEVVYVAEDVYGTRDIYIYREGTKTHSNYVRNEYMVAHADEFLVYDKTSSGTKHCVDLIEGEGLPYTEVLLG